MSDAYTAGQQKSNLDETIVNMMKSGKDINEILNTPYYFVAELMNDQDKKKESTSLIAAFGG